MKESVVPLKSLVPDANQPRQEFDPKQLKLLAQSIKQKGILVPITVEKLKGDKYLVVDGERRFRAATMLKLEKVPVFIHDSMDEMERISLRFHIQEQHASWTQFDKARAISIMKQSSGASAQELGDLLGISSITINEYLGLLSLSKRMVNFANARKLNFRIVQRIAVLKRAVQNVEFKKEIENALIEKFITGVVENAAHITAFTTSIKFLEDLPTEQDKLIKKIISDKNYTPLQATKESGRGDYLSQREVLSSCTEIQLFIKRVKKTGIKYSLAVNEADHINKTLNALAEYIDSAEAA